MYNTFIQNIGKLLGDLFKIWSYPSFGVLLTICGTYMCVKLVKGMAERLL